MIRKCTALEILHRVKPIEREDRVIRYNPVRKGAKSVYDYKGDPIYPVDPRGVPFEFVGGVREVEAGDEEVKEMEDIILEQIDKDLADRGSSL
jgi:hypothetical protein